MWRLIPRKPFVKVVECMKWTMKPETWLHSEKWFACVAGQHYQIIKLLINLNMRKWWLFKMDVSVFRMGICLSLVEFGQEFNGLLFVEFRIHSMTCYFPNVEYLSSYKLSMSLGMFTLLPRKGMNAFLTCIQDNHNYSKHYLFYYEKWKLLEI